MSQDPPENEITVAGLEGWLPLDLTRTPEEIHAFLLTEYPSGDDVTTATAAALVDMARTLQQQNTDGDGTGSLNLAAWVLLDDPTTLSPIVMATLRGVASTESDPMAIIAGLAAGSELYDEPPVLALATASGPASRTRLRLVERVEGERDVHEQALVFWPRPQLGYAVVLSAYSTDLVVADRVGDALRQLAEGIGGL